MNFLLNVLGIVCIIVASAFVPLLGVGILAKKMEKKPFKLERAWPAFLFIGALMSIGIALILAF